MKMTRTRVVYRANWGRCPYHVELHIGKILWMFDNWVRIDIFQTQSDAQSYAKRYVELNRTLPDHGSIVETYDEQDLLVDKLKGTM